MGIERVFAKVLYHYGFIKDFAYDRVKIVCPFHDDDKPSLEVNIPENFFYCYGCCKKGNAVDFIKGIEKCNDLKAIVIYNQIVNDKNIGIKIISKPPKTQKENIADAKHYFYSLPDVNWFDVERDNPALNYMLSRGFTRKVMQRAGIRINYNDTYPVIMPMVDNGRFKGYVSRAVLPAERKYLYNEGFRRKSTLVGKYFKPWVVITEGYMDWLKLQQYGIENSVAILGWKISDAQISKLQQVTDKVISALDNTETGEKGTEYLKEYFDVKRFKFPSSLKDVGDLNKYQFNKCWLDTIKNKM
jgi:DNA primase